MKFKLHWIQLEFSTIQKFTTILILWKYMMNPGKRKIESERIKYNPLAQQINQQ